MSSFDRQHLTDSSNQFALDLYAKLSMGHSTNLFFSPFSVSTALAMTLCGARGKTEREMAEMLHLPCGDGTVHAEYGSLIPLIFGDKLNGCELSLANRLWGQSGYDFRSEFFELLCQHYKTQLETLDLVGQPEAAIQRINQWAGECTKGKVPALISEGAIDKLTRMILANAIYFKGKWEESFDMSATEDAPFHLSPSESTEVKMMHQLKYLSYTEVNGVQILEIPYKDRGLSMVVLLPRRDGEFQSFERRLTLESMGPWLSQLRSYMVWVYLPRFQLKTEFKMSRVLQSLGMVSAFSPEGADFSGMSERKPGLFLSEVIHKAYMETNEEGSEAAAATFLTMTLGSAESAIPIPRIVEFRADHPFVLLIRDRLSGIILFMGRVTDPNRA